MISEEGSTESHRYGYDAMNRQGMIIRCLFDRGELAAEIAGAKQKSYRRGYQIVSQEEQGNVQYYLRARFYNPTLGRFTQEDIYRGMA